MLKNMEVSRSTLTYVSHPHPPTQYILRPYFKPVLKTQSDTVNINQLPEIISEDKFLKKYRLITIPFKTEGQDSKLCNLASFYIRLLALYKLP